MGVITCSIAFQEAIQCFGFHFLDLNKSHLRVCGVNADERWIRILRRPRQESREFLDVLAKGRFAAR